MAFKVGFFKRDGHGSFDPNPDGRAALALAAVVAGVGIAASQETPDPFSDKQPCTDHPCEGYAYVAHYFLADGRINSVTTWDLKLEGPVQPEAAFAPRPGMASVVIADAAGRQMLKDVFENANGQDYYIDLGSLTLKRRAAKQPSPTSDLMPPAEQILVIAAGAIGLAVLVPTAVLAWRRIRHRRSIG